MRYLLFIFVTTMICNIPIYAATKKPVVRETQSAQASVPASTPVSADTTWEKEPNAFLGVKFNEPFTVKPCPMMIYGQYARVQMLDHEAMKSLDGVCISMAYRSENEFQKLENGIFRLENTPNLSIGYIARVRTKNGVVSKITIDLKQPNFDKLLTAFKDRYGTPNSVKNNTVKTNMGAEFNASEVIWKGKKISIYMYERMDKVDESFVVISDNGIMEEEMSEQRTKNSSEAQKF